MNGFTQEVKFLITSLLLVSGLFLSSTVFGSGLFSFGGKVTGRIRCTCSTGYQVTIKGGILNSKSRGTYLYLPGTPTGNASTGKKIIGKYSSGGECLIGYEPDCDSLDISKGTIKSFRTN
jgi:hypothetical protein